MAFLYHWQWLLSICFPYRPLVFFRRAWTNVHPRPPFPSTRVLRVPTIDPDCTVRNQTQNGHGRTYDHMHEEEGRHPGDRSIYNAPRRTPPWRSEHIQRSMKDATLEIGAYLTLHEGRHLDAGACSTLHEGRQPGDRTISKPRTNRKDPPGISEHAKRSGTPRQVRRRNIGTPPQGCHNKQQVRCLGQLHKPS
jgi:hypothetical protein